MEVKFFGIRHHGVGSAQKLEQALAEFEPSLILVEGPPELSEAFDLVGLEGLKPPLAVMVYDTENPRRSAFYPFAEYSPEWVALTFARQKQILVKPFDAPFALRLSRDLAQQSLDSVQETETHPEQDPQAPLETAAQAQENPEQVPLSDPMDALAELEGFATGAQWWDYHFENTRDFKEHFDAVLEVMGALREAQTTLTDEFDLVREACMRQSLRQAVKDGFDKIAVVCGAWHAPALLNFAKGAKDDSQLIKAQPSSKFKIASAWVPWTNERLALRSGYGAGLESPGWSEHQWKTQPSMELRWLVKVAKTFRKKGQDISTAHVIETFRLAQGLGDLRGRQVGLPELDEAIQSVMCMGDALLMSLIQKKLVVGERIGKIPADIPRIPLQEDFEKTVKALRLKIGPTSIEQVLDLRKELDLRRSVFFHRLKILDMDWASSAYVRSKGTYKEIWHLNWKPELMLVLVEKSLWGNAVEEASNRILADKSSSTQQVYELVDWIAKAIPAELFDGIDGIVQRIQALSAISADVQDLMVATGPLVQLARYGDVRGSDQQSMLEIAVQLISKVCIGLAGAAYGLDAQQSNLFFQKMSQFHKAILLLDQEELNAQWYGSLVPLLHKEGVHSLVKGCAARLLYDTHQMDRQQCSVLFAAALSLGEDVVESAHWIQGFLHGSGMILIYDEEMWALLNEWVESLCSADFVLLLPVLRRAFAHFEYGERRQIGAKAANASLGRVQSSQSMVSHGFSPDKAAQILPILSKFLGLGPGGSSERN